MGAKNGGLEPAQAMSEVQGPEGLSISNFQLPVWADVQFFQSEIDDRKSAI